MLLKNFFNKFRQKTSTNFLNKNKINGYANIYLNNIIEKVPGYVFWKDINSNYLGCNNKFASLAGKSSAKEIIGKNDFDLKWGPGEPELFRHGDQEVMAGKEKNNIEEFLIRPDGSQVVMLVSKVALQDSNRKCIGILGISMDITEKKKLELELIKAKQQEEELRKAIMVLAGSIAHDLRTPLATVGAIGHTLNEVFPMLVECYKRNDKKDIPPSQQLLPHQLKLIANFPQKLNSTTHEMNAFIDDSLKALRTAITGIKSQDDLIQCSLWSCLQNALERYPFSTDEKKLIHWDRSYEFNFMGNPILFYRIIFNLVKNALYQIHKNGRGEIYISAEQANDVNLLKIKDTAGGVTEETVQKIFNGFQSAKEGGTGVGLAFCKLAMQSIGGDIDYRLVGSDKIEFILSFSKIIE